MLGWRTALTPLLWQHSAKQPLIYTSRNANNRKIPFIIFQSSWRTCKIWKNKHCWDIVLLHFSCCFPLCLIKLSVVCIFKWIGGDGVQLATALSIGPIIERLSSFFSSIDWPLMQLDLFFTDTDWSKAVAVTPPGAMLRNTRIYICQNQQVD